MAIGLMYLNVVLMANNDANGFAIHNRVIENTVVTTLVVLESKLEIKPRTNSSSQRFISSSKNFHIGHNLCSNLKEAIGHE